MVIKAMMNPTKKTRIMQMVCFISTFLTYSDIMYEDFFGPREPTKKIEPAPKFRQELKDDDLDGYYSTPAEKAPPSPTFEDIAQPAAADLFQDVNMSANLSSFERNQEKLTTRIAALEGQAVADKAWQLAGESTAKSRPVNALLGEADLGIDYASKPVPIISVDSTLGLEERIKARIRDGIFDSVERKIVTIDKRRMKKDRTGEDEKSGQSLVQVYEKEYLRQSAEVKTAVVEKEESKEELEAIALYAVLVDQLDALSNSHYTPVREVPGGMEVVVQAPAISVEEVIPGHVSNAQLVAPGDVYRAGLKQSRGEMESVDLRREKRGRKAKGRKEGAKAEVKKSDGSSGGAVKELLGMDNVTMIKGKDGAVGDDKGGKKRKAKVMEEGGEIGAKGGRSSANFIRL
jgi:U3 small nucleolar RNA-associated protein MPP10